MFVVQNGYEASKSMSPEYVILALLIGIVVAAAFFTVIFIAIKENKNRKK
jgi:hypothetical protein